MNRAYGGVLSGGAVRERWIATASVYARNNQLFCRLHASYNILLGFQDHPSLLDRRAEDREESFEDPEG